jgi:hypothetical protein
VGNYRSVDRNRQEVGEDWGVLASPHSPRRM